MGVTAAPHLERMSEAVKLLHRPRWLCSSVQKTSYHHHPGRAWKAVNESSFVKEKWQEREGGRKTPDYGHRSTGNMDQKKNPEIIFAVRFGQKEICKREQENHLLFDFCCFQGNRKLMCFVRQICIHSSFQLSATRWKWVQVVQKKADKLTFQHAFLPLSPKTLWSMVLL